MKEIFDLLGLGTFFSPALVISGIVYKLFVWAEVRLPPVSDYARSWLLGTNRPFSLGFVLHHLNTLLIGRRWNDKRRLLLTVLPTCAALAWLMLKHFPSDQNVMIYSTLSFLQKMLIEIWYALPALILISVISGLISFSVYDRATKGRFDETSSEKMWFPYLIVLATSLVIAFVALQVMSILVIGLPALPSFTLEPCINASSDHGCTVSGMINNSIFILSNLLIAFALLPVGSVIFLSFLFIISVSIFPYVAELWQFVSSKYFSMTDQKLALEKPLEFLAPVASAIAFMAAGSLTVMIALMR